MGGTIYLLVKSGFEVNVLFLSSGVGSRDIERQSEQDRKLSAKKALSTLGCEIFEFASFPDNQFDKVSLLEIAKRIELQIDKFRPEIVFTNFHSDLNIDHRLTSEATQIATRPKTGCSVKELYFYEIPSSTGWYHGGKIFSPNRFVDISLSYQAKIMALNYYQIELDDFPNARSIESINSYAKQRGAQSGLNYAEAFEIAYIRNNF